MWNYELQKLKAYLDHFFQTEFIYIDVVTQQQDDSSTTNSEIGNAKCSFRCVLRKVTTMFPEVSLHR